MRRVLVFLALAVLPLAATGCGAEELKKESPRAAVATAATKASMVGTARISIKASMQISGFAEPFNLTGAGVADYRNDRSRFTIDISELAELAPPALGAPRAWRGEIVYDQDVVYMRLPALKRFLPRAKRWIRVDGGTRAAQGGTAFSMPDPAEFLRFARAAGRVRVIGKENVRGVETTHYRGTIDVGKLPGAVPPGERAALDAYARRLRAAGVASFPLDIWLDEDGLTRRVSAEYNNMKTGQRRANISFSMELFDFGAAVDVALPRPNQVSDLHELVNKGAGYH